MTFWIETALNLVLIGVGWGARIMWVSAMAKRQEAAWFDRSIDGWRHA